jgi:hypothetical protein
MNARPSIPPISKSGGRIAPKDNLIRAMTAALVAKVRHTYPADVARSMWSDDRVTPLLLERSAVAPASVGDASWAGILAATSVADYIGSVATQCAAARLLASGLQVNLRNYGSVSVPKVTTPFAPAWIGENSPIPVGKLALAANPVGPYSKLAIIAAFTNEMARSSGIENLVRLVMVESTAASLDAALLSSTAASDDRPAGIFHGTAALTATAGGGEAAMVADLEKLIAAIVTAGGGNNIAFVGHPSQVAAIRLRSGANFTYPLFATKAFSAGTIAAAELGALASALNPQPDIDVSEGAVVHLDDADPLPFVDGGAVAAGTVMSAFQTGALTLRCILEASWTVRGSGLAQHITGTTW